MDRLYLDHSAFHARMLYLSVLSSTSTDQTLFDLHSIFRKRCYRQSRPGLTAAIRLLNREHGIVGLSTKLLVRDSLLCVDIQNRAITFRPQNTDTRFTGYVSECRNTIYRIS